MSVFALLTLMNDSSLRVSCKNVAENSTKVFALQYDQYSVFFIKVTDSKIKDNSYLFLIFPELLPLI